MPAAFGSSPLTVRRVGHLSDGKFIPDAEGGIEHRKGSVVVAIVSGELSGERVALSLLGDGYVEAIADRDIERNAVRDTLQLINFAERRAYIELVMEYGGYRRSP
jgi:hypothetical protein